MKKKRKLPEYKQHDGEKGSAADWKKVAEKLLGVREQSDETLKLLKLDAMPSTLAELRRAYKKAMLEAHPDRGGTDEQAANVTAAYDELRSRLRS